jgi:hypothetical protein
MINKISIKREVIAQTQTHMEVGEGLRKKLWRGLADNCSRRWYEFL